MPVTRTEGYDVTQAIAEAETFVADYPAEGSTPEARIFYHAMLGNGSGDGSETNDGKKIMASLGFRPTKALAAQVYADYEDRPGATDRRTLQTFVGWNGSRARYGLQYAVQERKVEAGPDDEIAVAMEARGQSVGLRVDSELDWDRTSD